MRGGGQGYRSNQPAGRHVLKSNLLFCLSFGFFPSLKILSGPSVVQGAGFLQEEAFLDGDGVVTDITQVASFLCCPSLFPICSQDPLELFSRELCFGHLGDNKLLLSKTNSIFFFFKCVV